MEKSDLENYIQEAKEMDETWKLSNDVLYELCKKHPSQKNNQEVIAKLYLIGRTYAASIERGAGKNGDIYTINIPRMVSESGEKLDQLIGSLNRKSKIEDVFYTYNYLLSCFHKISGKWNKSLTSKYLHFHKPELYFLMDSRARSSIHMILEVLKLNKCISKKDLESYRNMKEESQEYFIFYLKCRKCIDSIEQNFGIKLSSRDFDNVLLTIYEKEIKNV